MSMYSLFPIRNKTLYKFYEDQRDAFWVPAEVDLNQDVKDWNEKLTSEDKHFLLHTLAFFAQADGLVLENIENNFSLDINIPEAKIFYGIQAGIEAIHWEMYGLLIETLIKDPQSKSNAFNAIEKYPCIKQKADWILSWMTNDRPYIERLVAFACTEGIFFSSAFASIYYYKSKGLMPGLCLSNRFIARDEGIHRDFGCALFKHLLATGHSITPERVREIVESSVAIEDAFVNESLNVNLIGINAGSMKLYVHFVADHLLQTLGYPKKYMVANPFDWMDIINLQDKGNFFEGRISDYSKKNTATGTLPDGELDAESEW